MNKLILNFKSKNSKKIKNPKNFLGGKGANLSEMGVQKDSIPDLAAHAAKDVSNFTNPRPVSGEEYESLFEIALS